MDYSEKISIIQSGIIEKVKEFKDLKDEILSSWSDELSNIEKSNIIGLVSNLDSKIELMDIALSEDIDMRLHNLLAASDRFKNKMK